MWNGATKIQKQRIAVQNDKIALLKFSCCSITWNVKGFVFPSIYSGCNLHVIAINKIGILGSESEKKFEVTFYIHSAKISEFFYHSFFMWNQSGNFKTMKFNLELYRGVIGGYSWLQETPRRKWSFFVTDTQTLHQNIYIAPNIRQLKYRTCLLSPSDTLVSSSALFSSYSSFDSSEGDLCPGENNFTIVFLRQKPTWHFQQLLSHIGPLSLLF